MPVWGGRFCRSGSAGLQLVHSEVQGVEVGASLAAAPDFNEVLTFQLAQIGADTALRGAHVLGEALLAREAKALLPGIAKEHGVDEFRPGAYTRTRQDMVRDPRVAALGQNVSSAEGDVPVEYLGDGADAISPECFCWHLRFHASSMGYVPKVVDATTVDNGHCAAAVGAYDGSTDDMSTNPQASSSDLPKDSDVFGTVPSASEEDRSVPQPSEPVGGVPKDAAERGSHTLTVQQVARMFEAAGVARTERSVINWCRPDAEGVSRLDSYLDPNEHRRFITPESVERAIQEELAKARGAGRELPRRPDSSSGEAKGQPEELERLRKRVQELEIEGRMKAQALVQMGEERKSLLDRIEEASRLVGRLETTVEFLKAPGGVAGQLPRSAEEAPRPIQDS